MSNRDAVERLTKEAGFSAEDCALIREQEADSFWALDSLAYFEDRLLSADVDVAFEAAVPVETGTRRHRFALTLWPDFNLGVLVGHDGRPFYPHFVRRSQCELFLPIHLRELQPWSATLEEIVTRFGPWAADDSWDQRRWVSYREGGTKYTLSFDFSLLQTVARG
jgi:hypothetical protein